MLEILKLRSDRWRRLAGAPGRRGAHPGQVDEGVARELETGSFEVVNPETGEYRALDPETGEFDATDRPEFKRLSDIFVAPLTASATSRAGAAIGSVGPLSPPCAALTSNLR